MNASTLKWGAVAGLVALGAYVVLRYGDKVAKGVAGVADSVNPFSESNVFYSTANAATGLVTGKSDETFGGWIFDTFSPKAQDLEDFLKAPAGGTVPPTVAQKAMEGSPAINQNVYTLSQTRYPVAPAPKINAIGSTGVLTDSKYRDMVR